MNQKEKWVVTAKRADFEEIGKRFSIDPVTARIIRNRDVIGEEAMEEYLHGGIESMHDPRSMKDAEKAAGILRKKIEQGKKIRIIGDYDIDGVQSTYILVSALKECGAEADIAIPDRIMDGYGLNERLIREASEDGIDTVLTCDNGIAAGDVIGIGKELGMTVIVTDHHEVPYEEKEDGTREYLLPPADAVVNPKQQDCCYPYKNLCGAAVAYKLIQVLYEDLGRPLEAVHEFLPYAAFATIGDVMDLNGENRVLVKEGLKRLRRTKNKGLNALMMQNNLEPESLKAYHIGFILGPCLNASGRLDTAVRALKLMQAEDEGTARSLAKDLTDLNTSRKELTASGVEQAVLKAEAAIAQGERVLVLYLPECHESLAGIIAGRIRERYNRPVFVLTKTEDGVKGSGRSVENYSMFEEMSRCKELYTKYGGHPMAAGLSLKEENVEVFRRRINELSPLKEEDLIPRIRIDVPMPVDYITDKLIHELSLLEPFGKGNEKPVFADKNLKILTARVLGKNKNVLKMQIESQFGTKLPAVFFGDTEAFLAYIAKKSGADQTRELLEGRAAVLGMSFVYYPEINCYQGKETIQLVVKNYG